MFGFDSETFPFRPGLPTPRQVCASWSDGEKDDVTLWPDTRARFVKLLERGDHLVGVNIAYDVVGCAAMDPDLLPLIFRAGNAGQFHCCSIREALNDIAKGELVEKSDDEFDWNRYSMALLMLRHFNEDISAEKKSALRVGYAHLDGIPLDRWSPEERDYPKRDARRPLLVFHSQAGFRNLHDEPAQVRAAIALQFMRTWGFRTDGDYIDNLEREVDGIWNAAREDFASAGIFRPDGTKDTKFVASLVTKAYNGDPPMTAGRVHKATGKRVPAVATDRDTLEESGDPLLTKLAVAEKSYSKRKKTDIPALREGIDVPVTPNFNVLCVTGRVSSDRQQMPQKGRIREGIRSRPGTVLSFNDLAGGELRTMSQRAILEPGIGFSKMADFLNAGKDTHSHVAAQFLGMTYEEFLPRKLEFDAYRKVGKIWNFGKGGGAGDFAMAYNAKVKENIRLCLTLKRATKCGVKLREGFIRGQKKRVCDLCVQIAKELGQKWLDAWPEQRMLVEKAQRLTNGKRKVESVTFGSNRVRGECSYTQWLNNPFQSALGDAVKAAMWRVEEESKTDRRSSLWDSHEVLNIHDELWTEHPDDARRHDAAFRVATILCEEMDKVTPDVKNEVEPAIARRPFKAAAKVFDRNGRLKCWWPESWSWEPDQEQMCADLAA